MATIIQASKVANHSISSHAVLYCYYLAYNKETEAGGQANNICKVVSIPFNLFEKVASTNIL